MRIIRYRLKELPELIPELWALMKHYPVIALSGELGSGKTTFIRTICQFLETNEPASSPTFSLINEYTYRDEEGNLKVIYHADWYRIKDEEEAIAAGIEDMLQQENAISIIEWPEKAKGLLPEHILTIRFEVEGADARKLLLEETTMAI